MLRPARNISSPPLFHWESNALPPVNTGKSALGTLSYGFNGQEKDDEAKGNGNSYDFGARIYDARLGRWMSVDFLASKYPSWSPYTTSLDNPIYLMDPDGYEVIPHPDERYVSPQQSQDLLGVNSPYTLKTIPQNIHQLGVTVVRLNTSSEVYYKKNSQTGKYDVHFKVYVFVNQELSPGYSLDKKNPGLRNAVWAHEKGHKDQWIDAFNATLTVTPFTYTENGVTKKKTYTGKIDDILDQADSDYEEIIAQFPNLDMTKEEYVKKVFNDALNQVNKVRQASAKPNLNNKSTFSSHLQPDLEYDANVRAAKTLKAEGQEVDNAYLTGAKKAYRSDNVELKNDGAH